MPEQMHFRARHGELRAPRDRFRLVLVDGFDHSDAILGDFPDRDAAVEEARVRAGVMKLTVVYDHAGRVVATFGTP